MLWRSTRYNWRVAASKPQEKLSEYIADLRKLVIKGYPTANESTRETIMLHHFLKGLPDCQAAMSVGRTNPRTVEEAALPWIPTRA